MKERSVFGLKRAVLLAISIGILAAAWPRAAQAAEPEADSRSEAAPPAAPAQSSAAAEAPAEAPTRLSDRAELDRIIELYLAGQYELCSSEFDAFLKDSPSPRGRDPEVSKTARFYAATCALLGGDEPKARALLRAALEQDPLMAPPDSLAFPPPLLSAFLQVRDEVQALIAVREQEEIRRLRAQRAEELARDAARVRRLRELEELARTEVVVAQAHRVVAFLPFGAGQYQNGQPALGALFLSSELALGLLAGGSGLILTDLYAQASRVPPGSGDNAKFQAAYAVLTVSSWAFVATMVAGIVEANIQFRESRVVGRRARSGASPPERQPPAPVAVVPFVSPVEGGVALGASGHF